MMILSQDKKMCVPFEKGLTYVNYNYNYSNKIYWSETADGRVEGIFLGEYNFEKDAKIVLEQILQSFCNKRYVFEMPQFDEV